MHVVIRHLVNNPNFGALWMDTTGDFSPGRVTQLIQLHDSAVCNLSVTVHQLLMVLWTLGCIHRFGKVTSFQCIRY
jgi:hypothetical protein